MKIKSKHVTPWLFQKGYERKDTVYPILCVWFRGANFYNFDKYKRGYYNIFNYFQIYNEIFDFLVNVDMSCYCRDAMKAVEHHNATANDFGNNLIIRAILNVYKRS